MDDLWGEDLADDVIEECLLVASQVEANLNLQNPNHTKQNITSSSNTQNVNTPDVKHFNSPKSDAEFAVPRDVRDMTKSETRNGNVKNEEIAKLKNENDQLREENICRSGETTMLRTEVQKMQQNLQKKEQEMSMKILQLRNEMAAKESEHTREVQAVQAELQFKELELVELRSKYRRSELGNKANVAVPYTDRQTTRQTTQPNFLNETSFFRGKTTPTKRAKSSTTEAGVQVDILREIATLPGKVQALEVNDELDFNRRLRIIKTELALSTQNKDIEFSSTAFFHEAMSQVLRNDSDFGFSFAKDNIIDIVCSYLNTQTMSKRPENCMLFDFVATVVSRVLPQVENSDCLLNSVIELMSEHLQSSSFYICNVIKLMAEVIQLNWSALCTYPSGCLLRVCVERVISLLETSTPDLGASVVTLTSSLLLSDARHLTRLGCRCARRLLSLFTSTVETRIARKESEFFSQILLDQSFHLVLALLSVTSSEPLCNEVQQPSTWRSLLNALRYFTDDVQVNYFFEKSDIFKELGLGRRSGGTTSGEH